MFCARPGENVSIDNSSEDLQLGVLVGGGRCGTRQ